MIPQRFTDFYGDQVRWFTGKVISIDDPKTLGRIKVRIHGIHSDDVLDIPDSDLPWAQVVAPITEGGTQGYGNPLGVQVGALVFGIFMDGPSSQLPLIFGSLPKFEGDDRTELSVNQLATGTQTKPYTPDEVISEPEDPYAAQYPNNLVYETTAGHVKEYDNTPNSERIRELHKSGTFYQVNPDGTLITHIVRDRYEVLAGNDAVHIKGNVTIVVDGNTTIDCKNVRITGDVSVGGDVTTDAGVSLNNHTHTDTPGLGAGITSKPN